MATGCSTTAGVRPPGAAGSRTPRPRGVRLVSRVAVGALVLVVAGCGHGGSSPGPTPSTSAPGAAARTASSRPTQSQPTGVDAPAEVAAALESADAASTLTRGVLFWNAGATQVTYQVMDLRRSRMATRSDAHARTPDMIVDKEALWRRLGTPEHGKHWEKLTPASRDEVERAAVAVYQLMLVLDRPALQLSALAERPVKDLGHHQDDAGRDNRWFAVTVEAGDLRMLFPGLAEQMVNDVPASDLLPDTTEVTVHLMIGPDRLPTSLDMDLSASGFPFAATVTWTDWNAGVDIRPPARSDTVIR